MEQIESGDYELYDDWRERLQKRAVDSGWKIPESVRETVVNRLVTTIENPETSFESFTKAVNMLAKLERAEQTAVANAVHVTRWAESQPTSANAIDIGVMVRVPHEMGNDFVTSTPLYWGDDYHEGLTLLADKLAEFGLPVELVNLVRQFDISQIPEPVDPEPDPEPRPNPKAIE